MPFNCPKLCLPLGAFPDGLSFAGFLPGSSTLLPQLLAGAQPYACKDLSLPPPSFSLDSLLLRGCQGSLSLLAGPLCTPQTSVPTSLRLQHQCLLGSIAPGLPDFFLVQDPLVLPPRFRLPRGHLLSKKNLQWGVSEPWSADSGWQGSCYRPKNSLARQVGLRVLPGYFYPYSLSSASLSQLTGSLAPATLCHRVFFLPCRHTPQASLRL